MPAVQEQLHGNAEPKLLRTGRHTPFLFGQIVSGSSLMASGWIELRQVELSGIESDFDRSVRLRKFYTWGTVQ